MKGFCLPVILAMLLTTLPFRAFCVSSQGAADSSQSSEQTAYTDGGDWILGAAAFSVEKHAAKALQDAAAAIPSLMLEKISGDAAHILSIQEKNDRRLYALQTERLSLFLQLSREIKVRDSLILGNDSQRRLNKKIKAQEKKIAELKDKIQENLIETDKAKAKTAWDGKENSLVEKIAVYEKDPKALVSLENSGHDTLDSLALSKGFSGLITGSIESYGGFVAVTAELHTYPGTQSPGSVTEIGSIDELPEIADNLVIGLLPKIANTIPVDIYFTVTPESASQDAQIFIDGILQKKGSSMATVAYGEHKIEISAPGYFTKSVSYRFTESADYSMVVPMEAMSDGTFNITFTNKDSGNAYADGALLGYIDETNRSLPVQINGKPVLGHFVVEDQDGKSHNSYYYVSGDVQQDDSELAVNLRRRYTVEEVDQKRLWSYRGYSALMLAVPVAMLAYGKYLTASDGYKLGAETADTVDNWAHISNISTGLAVTAGGFFLAELIRYIHSASSMMPQSAYETKE